MSRQYFADVLTEPVNASFGTISSTSEAVIVPTAYTVIPANEPRAGKVYELIVGGTCTFGTSGTLILTARYGTVVGCSALATSPTQNYVFSVTNAPFLFRAYLIFRSIGIAGANSTAITTGKFEAGGAVATASSQTSVAFMSSAAISVDTSINSALWVGATFSVAPSLIPFWHVWRSLN